MSWEDFIVSEFPGLHGNILARVAYDLCHRPIIPVRVYSSKGADSMREKAIQAGVEGVEIRGPHSYGNDTNQWEVYQAPRSRSQESQTKNLLLD